MPPSGGARHRGYNGALSKLTPEMPRKFNPRTNPYAHELMRLRDAPPSRYSPEERYILGQSLAGKLYGVQRHWRFRWPYLAYFRIPRAIPGNSGSFSRQLVLFDVVFDNDSQAEPEVRTAYRHWLDRWQSPDDAIVVVLAIREDGVVEASNGIQERLSEWSDVLRAVEKAGIDRPETEAQDGVPALSDADAAEAYFGPGRSDSPPPTGRDPNGGRDDGGRDGGGRGSGPGGDGGAGDGGGSGAGGARELVNHPVLFSVDADVLRAILEQA